MASVVAFAAVLMVAALFSGVAHRSILSTAAFFLATGFILGDGVFDVVPVRAGDQVVLVLAELALFSVLFTDGMRISAQELRQAWKLPGRALLFGLPLTFVITAWLAHVVAGLPWLESFLIGAVLSPTDPVFCAAIVGREEIPYRLRHLLNVESGLNDGLALPVVIVLLTVAQVGAHVHALHITSNVVIGIALGVVIPVVAIWMSRPALLSPTSRYEPLYGFSIGMLIFGVTFLVDANPYLAAFAGGITVASFSTPLMESFHEFGELIVELLKLAALFVFGALITPSFLGEISAGGYAFAVLAILVARPLALAVALFYSELKFDEWLVAAWFGPKGFASVVYGLLVLESGIRLGNDLFHLIAITVVISIVAHSSTDVLIARWFEKKQVPDHSGSES